MIYEILQFFFSLKIDLQKTVDFCEDFLSINTNGLGRLGRSHKGFGISNNFNRKFAKKRHKTESIHADKCVLKLNTKSHFKGHQHLVQKKGEFSPKSRIKVLSMKAEGKCCWRIKTHYIRWDHHHCLVHWVPKGPFKYYVIKDVGGWDQKMAILDDLQHCKSSKNWVGGPKKVKNMMK